MVCLLFAQARRGFSLVELMVVLAIVAIIAAIAVPSFDSFMLSSRLSTYASDFSASARLARSEARKRNVPVTLCVSSNGSSCTSGDWGLGWVVLSGATVIRQHGAVRSGYQMTSATASVTFQPNGFSSTQAVVTVCRSSPVGNRERVVTVSATGRTTISKTQTGSCS